MLKVSSTSKKASSSSSSIWPSLSSGLLLLLLTTTTTTTTTLAQEASIISFSGSVEIVPETLRMNYFGDEDNELITMELVYEGDAFGWMGLGLGNSMVGSTAMIAQSGVDDAGEGTNPARYTLGGFGPNDVVLSDSTIQEPVSDATLTQNDTHAVMRWTRPLSEASSSGLGDIEPGTTIDFIYAYSASDATVQYHGQTRNTFTVDLESGGASVAAIVDTTNKWKAHGYCMAIAWGGLVPIAVSMSLLRSILPLPPGIWFKLHFFCNTAAFILTIAGFALAVSATNDEAGPNGAEHFTREKHHKIGLVIFLFAVVQVVSGVLRPHAPPPHPPSAAASKSDDDGAKPSGGGDDDDKGGDDEEEGSNENKATKDDSHGDGEEVKKTPMRLFFEIQHRVMGFVALALAWYNCTTGLEFFEIRFGDDRTTTFWVPLIIFLCIVVVLYIIQAVQKYSKK